VSDRLEIIPTEIMVGGKRTGKRTQTTSRRRRKRGGKRTGKRTQTTSR
jgi:hypothetical protein